MKEVHGSLQGRENTYDLEPLHKRTKPTGTQEIHHQETKLAGRVLT
jgi:hypothetical protein